MRAPGLLLVALSLVVAACPAIAQVPAPDKPLPPRDDIPDTTVARSALLPQPVSPLASPVRLNLTPQGAPPGATRIPEPEEVSSVFEPEVRWGEHELNAWARYNRVEGPAVHAALTRSLRRESYVPAYRLEFGFAFSADRGQYRVGFEQPVADKNKLTLGAEGYRSYLPFWYAGEALSSGENSASALFLHRDYWDWYEAEGVRGFVGFRPSPYVRVTLGVVQEDETALENRTHWSVFNQEADFPPNPPIPEGEYRGVEAAASYDSRPLDETGDLRPRAAWSSLEHWHRVSWERADGGLGGDFDLWRLTVDLRNYLRLTPNQVISTRILAGTGESREGALPAGRRFAVGGLGTLRGHLYRSVGGDHVALANFQYAFGVGKRGWLLFFADAGTAWDTGSVLDQRLPVDVGTGFRIGHSGPTLLVARTLDDDAEFRVEFRFEESY